MITPINKRSGVVYALAAYGWWGIAPFYFKAVAHVPALEVLAHRIVWSVILLAGLITGIVGGLVVAWLSGSALAVSGPAAGLIAIVLPAIAFGIGLVFGFY